MAFADLHCDTLRNLRIHGFEGDLAVNSGHLDLNRLESVGAVLQFFACFTDVEAKGENFETCASMAEYFREQVSLHHPRLKWVRNREDMGDAGLHGLLSVEDGGVIGDSEDLLDELHCQGVRSVTLTWNSPNSLGFPNHQFLYADQGLTPFGKRMTEKMAAQGILVDVSHLSDAGFRDVADIVRGPFIASHSNAREVFCHSRNLTDAMIRQIAERGGVIGLNFFSQFLDGSEHMTVEALLRHFEHIYRKGGADVLALGSDFDGIDCTLEIEGVQGLPRIEAALVKAGYSADVIEKALWRNALRVVRDVLPSAGRTEAETDLPSEWGGESLGSTGDRR